MRYKEFSYSELVVGGIKGKLRNNVLSFVEINQRMKSNGQAGCYRNHFRFTHDYKEYAQRNNSVKGYAGTAYVDYLWVDIDNATDVSISLETAKTYINRLLHVYAIAPEYLRCYFSGSKGFHIGIPSEVFGLEPSPQLPAVCKELAAKLGDDLDIDYSIYDTVRLLRLADTQHEKSGLYKVELEPKEILNCADVSEIQTIAKSPRRLVREYDPEDAYGVLAHLLDSIEIEPVTSREAPREKATSEFWVADMLENGITTGGRVNGLRSLAGYFKSINMPEDVALATLRTWDLGKNNPPLSTDPDEKGELERTVRNIYAMPGLEGKEQSASAIQYHNWASIHDAAPEYVEKFSRNRIKFGYDKIDRKSALLGRGEVAIILAYVGVGKTVLVQNIQLYTSQYQHINSILFSLEMHSMRLYFRQLGMIWGMSAREIEDEFAKGNGEDMKRGMDKYSNVYIVDHIPLSVPLMADCIKQAPVDIGLAIVDYVGLLSDEGKDEYEQMKNISRELVLMAKTLNVAVIAVYQTNRTGSNGEIYLGMGRGSGHIEANCDIALGFWQDEKDPTQRHLKLLKARHGMAGTSELLGFTGSSPRLYSMERSEE